MCVRYSGVAVDSPPDVANNILADELLNQEQVTWVGHCLVTMVTRETKADRLVVHMDLHQSAVGLPDELLQQPQNTPRRATVEWIAKTLPDRWGPRFFIHKDKRTFRISCVGHSFEIKVVVSQEETSNLEWFFDF